MNEELNKFLEDNIHLLEQGLFLDAFLLCPRFLRRSLVKVFKDAKIDVTDTGVHDYMFKYQNGYVLIASKYSARKDVYEFDSAKSSSGILSRVLIIDDLARAMEFAANTSTEPSIVPQSTIDTMKLVPIKLSDGTDCLMSQEGVDYFDPNILKDRRYQLAAQQELNDRLTDYTRSTYNIARLKTALEEFEPSNNAYHIRISSLPAEIVISMNHDPSSRDNIKDVLVRLINSPIDIVWDDPILDGKISVKLKSKKIDLIKNEVKDQFGVDL